MPSSENVAIVVSGITAVGAAFGIAQSAIALRKERKIAREEREEKPWLYTPTTEEIRRIVNEQHTWGIRERRTGTSSSPIGGSSSGPSYHIETKGSGWILGTVLSVWFSRWSAALKRLLVSAAVAGVAGVVLVVVLIQRG